MPKDSDAIQALGIDTVTSWLDFAVDTGSDFGCPDELREAARLLLDAYKYVQEQRAHDE
jgi:hypothetical protein